jgi:signal transduction histidine kinase
LDRDDLPSFVADNLHRLNNQVLRMERLIKDLLKLSSLETMNSIEPKPVDMCRLLTSLTAEYQFLAEPRNIKINNSLPNQLLLHGDDEKLTRAFSNILDNAVKYNVDGGRIEMTGCQSAEELTIVITNTGPGVSEVEIPKLFDQFYRAEKSRSLQHGGSGLGLTIVRRIVELHGGRVKIANRQEGWTEVKVTLPLRRDTISI